MMLTKNPKALIVYRDTQMVSLHMNLRLAPRISTPLLNLTRDPILAKFYDRVITSIRRINRITNRLFSIQGITDLLECDSYLRRFYGYVLVSESTLRCPTRHYANSFTKCQQWAVIACHTSSPDERDWLNHRTKRSSYWCHSGLAGIPRFFYELGRENCESLHFTDLLKVLRGFATIMSEAHNLMKTLNGKVIYLVKTTDMINSKLTQVIGSLRDIKSLFHGWRDHFTSFFKAEQCHFNMQQEFLAAYTMEVNRAFSSLLRLTEVDDLLRQLSHLFHQNILGFANLPQFLTEELTLKLKTVPSLSSAIDALRDGFSIILNPLMDIQFSSTRQLQLHLLFTLPVLSSEANVCSAEELVPIVYRTNDHCFGGAMLRYDLTLITCGNTRYVIKISES